MATTTATGSSTVADRENQGEPDVTRPSPTPSTPIMAMPLSSDTAQEIGHGVKNRGQHTDTINAPNVQKTKSDTVRARKLGMSRARVHQCFGLANGLKVQVCPRCRWYTTTEPLS